MSLPEGKKQMSSNRIGKYGYKNSSSFVVNIVTDAYREGWEAAFGKKKKCNCKESGEAAREGCEGCEKCSENKGQSSE